MVKLFPIGGQTPKTTKGKYMGNGSPVILATHDDNHPLVGRKINTTNGGLNNRKEWCQLQSGGMTPADILRQARD